jgi:trehalose utilization protein
MPIKHLYLFLLLAYGQLGPCAEQAPIRVLVWDVQQPAQKQAYGDDLFLGETIAAHLKTLPGLSVTSTSLSADEQGLDEAVLDRTDVLVMWDHMRWRDLDDGRAERVVTRVLAGRLNLLALHSAHWTKPFVRLMQERAKADAVLQIPEAERATAHWTYLDNNPIGQGVKPETPLSPFLEKIDDGWRLTLPRCVFPAWRADGAPSHVTTLLKDHPLARGLPVTWDIPQTEMYGGPFHVPKPDAVVFSERWDKGETFSYSGATWMVGAGRVCYFRPGHETFAVYRQAQPLLVVENAVRWMGTKP